MQRKSEPPKPVSTEGKNFQDCMLPVNSPELKGLLAQSKYSGRELSNSVQLDDIIKGREDKKIENSKKTPLLFTALSTLLLIAIGLLPKSPVSKPRLTVISVSVLASASESPTTQRFTVVKRLILQSHLEGSTKSSSSVILSG